MKKEIGQGDCVKLPDGRIARVRESRKDKVKVRVKRKTSDTNQLLYFNYSEVKKINCPEGWMSPEGYKSYLRKTLAKMKQRKQAQKKK